MWSKLNDKQRKWVVIGGAVAALAILGAIVGPKDKDKGRPGDSGQGGGTGSGVDPSPAAKREGGTFTQNVISKAKYDQIETGMSYSRVVGIIGHDGEEVASNKVEGVPGVMESVTTKSYTWKNRDGSNANLIFQNDKLFQKAQFGLK